ncbi:MAG: precorrin-2 C(20)-methyltransferase [Firmicutes bacterium]|nr:precorrin-2 C(20)-methyltransferase [Bacillota bacterium]
MRGRLYGIGVGPGDPELLTMKAYRILSEVDVVASPVSSQDREGIALSIVEKALGRQVNRLELVFPMTREKKELELHWGTAVSKMLEKLDAGQDVAFVTLGDPLLYSTYCYVVRRLRGYPDIQITTIPGITSFSACTAAFNVPLAEGDETVAILPGMGDPSQLEEALRSFDNIILMKAASNYDQIVRLLAELGLSGNCLFASRLGHGDELLSTDVAHLGGQKKDYLSLMVVKRNPYDLLKSSNGTATGCD